MRRLAMLVVLGALLAAQAACADTLEYTYGAKVEGTLEEVTFQAGGIPSMYPRDLVQAIELREEGNDLVTLLSGTKCEGKLLTARFKSADGLMTINREKLRSIALAEGTVKDVKAEGEGKPASEKPAEGNEDQKAVEKDEVSAEDLAKRESLGQSRSLARAAFDKADQMREEEVQKLKDKYLKDCDTVVKDLDRLEQSVRSKLKRRREAEERYNYYREKYSGDSARYLRPPDFSDDGIEKDKRDYDNAKERKSRLKKTIDDEMEKMDGRRALRKTRVRTAYDVCKKQITEGEKVTEDEMKEKYFAALDLEQKTARDKKKEGEAGPLDGKRKPNPFDEMFKGGKEGGGARKPEKPGKEERVAEKRTKEEGDERGEKPKDPEATKRLGDLRDKPKEADTRGKEAPVKPKVGGEKPVGTIADEPKKDSPKPKDAFETEFEQ